MQDENNITQDKSNVVQDRSSNTQDESNTLQDKNSNKKIKILCMAIGTLLMGVFSLYASVRIVNYFSTQYLGHGAMFAVTLVALPVLSVYSIGIALSILTFREVKKARKNQIGINKGLIAITIVGLICSLSFVVSIPVAIREYVRREESRQMGYLEDEAEKKAYELKPEKIVQLSRYADCYSYNDSMDYRAARDAICSYLRYIYSNDWQRPQDVAALDSQKYTPGYYAEIFVDPGEERRDSMIRLYNGVSEISRSFVINNDYINKHYLIVPHRSCQGEENNSSISVWYMDGGWIYDEDDDEWAYSSGEEEEQFACMYYDYHSEPSFDELARSEESSFNMFGSEFKDFYEKLLEELKSNSSDNVSYNYSVPYRGLRGTYVYDNAAFMEDFFSDL